MNETLFADTPSTSSRPAGWQKQSLGPTFAGRALEVVARKKLSAPAEWEAFSWEVIDHKHIEASDILVRGMVPVGRTKKGRPKWGKVRDADRVAVSKADLDAAKREYEQTSGKCSDCIGGQYCCGASVDWGYKYRACPRCGGTGVPVVTPAGQSPSSNETSNA